MVLAGLFKNDFPDGLQKLLIGRAAAQQSAQVGARFAGKAGAQKALARQTYPQDPQNLPCTAAMKPTLPCQPGAV